MHCAHTEQEQIAAIGTVAHNSRCRELLERYCPAQVTDLKLLGANKNRYECVVSDGQDSITGMTTIDTAKQVAIGAIRDGSLIRLTDYACNLIGTVHKLILAGAGLSSMSACMHDRLAEDA